MRTDLIGKVGVEDLGRVVSLCGWVETVRDHGGLLFLHLRDHSGRLQAVLDPTVIEARVHAEFCVRVCGVIRRRPEGKSRTALDQNEIELDVSSLEILGACQDLPFHPSEIEELQVTEDTRLKFRVLDLRSDGMQKVLRFRSGLLANLRSRLVEADFVEVETPILARSTPEGARDFLVPSRLQPAQFYALPQSPQLFKQLLMIGGMDRYFQIARCFRDEDQRSNRQPEFTQLDLEMTFVDESDIQQIIEKLLQETLGAMDFEVASEFPRLTYEVAMERYGTDAPDLSFDLPMIEVTEVFRSTEFDIFRKFIDQDGAVKAIVIPARCGATRKNMEEIRAYA